MNWSAAVRDRRSWSVAGLSAVAIWVQAVVSVSAAGVLSVVVCTVLPVAALVLTLTSAVGERHSLAAGALMLAIPPSVLSGVANGERQGAVAMLAACGAYWLVASSPRSSGAVRAAITATIALLAATVLLMWVVSGPVREVPAPSWTVIVNGSGTRLRSAVAVVGEHHTMTPVVAQLLWWCGLGIVVGAAIVIGLGRLTALVPLALAVLIGIGWGIERWRGPVSVVGGAWLLSASIAYLGNATVARSQRGDRLATDRIGRTVSAVAGFVWAAGIAEQVKVAAAAPSLPGGNWQFWDGWRIETTSVPALVLLVVALLVPAALVATVWSGSALPRRSPGHNRHIQASSTTQ